MLWKLLWSGAAPCGLCPKGVLVLMGAVNPSRRACHIPRLPAEKKCVFPHVLWDSPLVCNVTTGPGLLNFWGLNDLSWKRIWAFWSMFWKSNREFPCIRGRCSTPCYWYLCFNKCFRASGCLVHTWKYWEINSIPQDLELMMYKLQQQWGWLNSWLWQCWSSLQATPWECRKNNAGFTSALLCQARAVYLSLKCFMRNQQKHLEGWWLFSLRLPLPARVYGSAPVSPRKMGGS